MKKFFGVLLLLMIFSANCLAMTFSQPVQVGKIIYANMGGYIFEQVSENNGVMKTDKRSIQRKIYDHGLARFGEGRDALYLHYDSYKATVSGKKINVISHGYAKFGDKNVKNTVNINVMLPEIYKIASNEYITFYMIHDSYDLPDENWWTLIGRRKDGVWVKYFSSLDVTKKYFGKQGNVWEGLAICCDNFRVSGNTMIIEYSRCYESGRKQIKEGEFQFKWDDKAQWFGVEQIIY